jgi:LysM repeat protein
MRSLTICLFLLVLLTACGAAPDLGTAAPSGPRPYLTASPSPADTLVPPLTEVFLPSPTPIIYVVVAGDTLSGIAAHYNVSLEALLAANPGIQPTALSVGTKLNIPGGEAVVGEPTPTAVPLETLQARCWPDAAGGAWCFVLVRNTYGETVENLSAQFTLLQASGADLASQVAYAPLDILPPGRSLPIAAYFPAPAPAGAAVRVELLTAIRLLPSDTRYLPAALQNSLVRVDGDGRSARVSGRIVCTAASGTAKTVWLLAVAYDASGEVVGTHRWESPAALQAGAGLDFDFQVGSLGRVIDHVDLLLEARQ